MFGKQYLEAGSWVKGKLRDGELIHGYIKAMDAGYSVASVYIVECDNEELIGKIVSVSTKALGKLPVSLARSEGQLINLIDFALLTKDKQWFMELSKELQSLREHSQINKQKSTIHLPVRHKNGRFDIKGNL
jgi:hypothetical protein